MGLLAASTLFLSACEAAREEPREISEEPARQEAAGPSPKELVEESQNSAMPDFSGAQHVAQFVDWASAAPVTRREEIRDQIHEARNNNEIALGLIREFQNAEQVDHSRALVILALLGEQRNATGVEFLIEYVWKDLPREGPGMVESGTTLEFQNMERLQVKAVNGLAYTKDPKALREVLEVVSKHPSKAVRAEAASSYLWNHEDLESARETLSQYLRKDELALLDRPVRGPDMEGEEFNNLLAIFLENHPELQPPEPMKHDPVEDDRPEEDQPPEQ